jgi:hypothetical protein
LVRAWSRDDNENAQKDGGSSTNGPQKKQEWWQSILSTDPTQQNNRNELSSESIRWNDGDDAATKLPPVDEQPLTEEEKHQFDDVYMEFVTNAFEEELDALRKGQLEEFTAARIKMKSTKPSITTGRNLSCSSSDASMGDKESTSAVELDPTQYSFVVASSANRDGIKKGVDTEAERAAAEAARLVAVQEIDIRVLSDMLYSGSNVLTTSEKRMLLQARQRALSKKAVMDDDADDADITLHERRKREIGLC